MAREKNSFAIARQVVLCIDKALKIDSLLCET